MNKFMIGNVIRTKYNNIEIVTKTTDEYVNTVSLEHTNVSFGHKTKDSIENVECSCVDMCNHASSDCLKCKGTGRINQIRYGSDSATLLASNVKGYILDRITKNFDF